MAGSETPFSEMTPEERNEHARLAGRESAARMPIYGLLRFSLRSVDVDGGTVEGEFAPNLESVHVGGMVSGSYFAAMLDCIVSVALSRTDPTGDPPPHVTTSLNINFLRATGPGTITGRGRVVRRGRSVGFTSGELLDAEGRTLATATSTAYFLPSSAG